MLSGVTVTISDLTFKDSTSSYGFIDNEGTLMLANSAVTGNTSTAFSGGGISNYGTLTLSNSTVSDNRGTFGGGTFNFIRTIAITNSTVSGNTAQGGGGILIQSTDNGNGVTDIAYVDLTFSTIAILHTELAPLRWKRKSFGYLA